MLWTYRWVSGTGWLCPGSLQGTPVLSSMLPPGGAHAPARPVLRSPASSVEGTQQARGSRALVLWSLSSPSSLSCGLTLSLPTHGQGTHRRLRPLHVQFSLYSDVGAGRLDSESGWRRSTGDLPSRLVSFRLGAVAELDTTAPSCCI